MWGKEITIIEDEVMNLRGSVGDIGGVGGQSGDRNNVSMTFMYEKQKKFKAKCNTLV